MPKRVLFKLKNKQNHFGLYTLETFFKAKMWKYFKTTVKFLKKVKWEIWQPKFVPTTNIFKNDCNLGSLPER